MCPSRSTLLGLALALSGCAACGDWYNTRGIVQDLPKVVAPTGVTLPTLACGWVSGTRTGFCEGRLPPDQVERIRVGLAMQPATPGAARPNPQGCRARSGFEQAPAFYRGLTGTGFDYASLHVGPDGHFCMELEYGYS
jgi:hypothetical protein